MRIHKDVFCISLYATLIGVSKNLISCDFEEGLCDWSDASSSSYDWKMRSGRTPDITSGPRSDHTFKDLSGHYIFSNGARASRTSVAVLTSKVSITTNDNLTFWYSMRGNGIGNLSLIRQDLNTSVTLWTRHGRQGMDWLQASVPLKSGTFQLRFETTVARPFGSDIALDDIRLSSQPMGGVKNSLTTDMPSVSSSSSILARSATFQTSLLSTKLTSTFLRQTSYSGSSNPVPSQTSTATSSLTSSSTRFKSTTSFAKTKTTSSVYPRVTAYNFTGLRTSAASITSPTATTSWKVVSSTSFITMITNATKAELAKPASPSETKSSSTSSDKAPSTPSITTVPNATTAKPTIPASSSTAMSSLTSLKRVSSTPAIKTIATTSSARSTNPSLIPSTTPSFLTTVTPSSTSLQASIQFSKSVKGTISSTSQQNGSNYPATSFMKVTPGAKPTDYSSSRVTPNPQSSISDYRLPSKITPDWASYFKLLSSTFTSSSLRSPISNTALPSSQSNVKSSSIHASSKSVSLSSINQPTLTLILNKTTTGYNASSQYLVTSPQSSNKTTPSFRNISGTTSSLSLTSLAVLSAVPISDKNIETTQSQTQKHQDVNSTPYRVPQHPGEDRLSDTEVVIIAVVCGTVVLIVFILVVWRVRAKRKSTVHEIPGVSLTSKTVVKQEIYTNTTHF